MDEASLVDELYWDLLVNKNYFINFYADLFPRIYLESSTWRIVTPVLVISDKIAFGTCDNSPGVSDTVKNAVKPPSVPEYPDVQSDAL